MSANTFIKWLSIIVLSSLLYATMSKSQSLRDFEQLLLTQPTINKFSDEFEKADDIYDLFPTDFSRWHQITLQNDEIKLLQNPTKNCLNAPAIECQLPKYENYMEISAEEVRRGKKSLKFVAQPARASASRKSAVGIRRHLFDFKEDSDLYFSGWFYLKQDPKIKNLTTRNMSFMGIRSAANGWRYRKEPGRFLLFGHHNAIASDLLYWLPKPEIYKQDILEEVSLPFNKWTNIRMHIKFSNDREEGVVEVWQGRDKILYAPGQTLPQDKTIYSILELGILNHEDRDSSQILYIDDIRIEDKAFFKM